MFNSKSLDYIEDFPEMIEKYISEISKLKNDKKFKTFTNEMKNKVIGELSEMRSIYDFNPNIAKDTFAKHPLSQYDTLIGYINNEYSDSSKTPIERSKSLRTKRKNMKCPECGKTLHMNRDIMLCKCGYQSEYKVTSINNNICSDNSKHTYKQLDAILGLKRPPSNITKIVMYIAIWLTDYSYIYKWLCNSTKKTKKDFETPLIEWMNKYYNITGIKITNAFFYTKPKERIPENSIDSNLFKLFMDEFYTMTERCKNISKNYVSNMEQLDFDNKIKIMREYVKSKGITFPSLDEVFTFNKTQYEVGQFFNNARLTVDNDDSLKSELNKIFKTDITFPGLMFDFNVFYPKGENIPRKYNYQQDYIYILHYTFNVPYIEMSMSDREEICSIILKFNNFYKNEFFTNNEKRCNSPLYCCSLSCLLDLPYFRKYKDILNIIPSKDKGTSNLIKNTWFKFMQKNPELIKQYTNNTDITKSNQIMEYSGINNFEIELKKAQSIIELEDEENRNKSDINVLPVFSDDEEDNDTFNYFN
jgi:hypothetical protein